MAEWIEGRQPVREALRAGRTLHRILIAAGAQERGALAEIIGLARAAGVPVERVPRARIDATSGGVHQGVIAEADPVRTRSWREGVEAARRAGQVPLLLALDGIQDPHNVGALLRTAEVLGVHGVLLPKRRAAGLTPAAVKASAGAVDHLVIDQVNSLERALADVRADGLWIASLAAEGTEDVSDCALLGEPVVVVVGAEGKGVSRLVRERSDVTVRIDVAGRIGSLNASVAGAICLWEAARRRRSAG